MSVVQPVAAPAARGHPAGCSSGSSHTVTAPSGCQTSTTTRACPPGSKRMECAITFTLGVRGAADDTPEVASGGFAMGPRTPRLALQSPTAAKREKLRLTGNGPLVVHVPAARAAVAMARPPAQYAVQDQRLVRAMQGETPCFAVALAAATDNSGYTYVVRYRSNADAGTKVIALCKESQTLIGDLELKVVDLTARVVDIARATVVAPGSPPSPVRHAGADPSMGGLVRFSLDPGAPARRSGVKPAPASMSAADDNLGFGFDDADEFAELTDFDFRDFSREWSSSSKPAYKAASASVRVMQRPAPSTVRRPAASNPGAGAVARDDVDDDEEIDESGDSASDGGDHDSDSDYTERPARRRRAKRSPRTARGGAAAASRSRAMSSTSTTSGRSAARAADTHTGHTGGAHGPCLRVGCNNPGYCQVPASVCVDEVPPTLSACQNCYVWLRRHFQLDKTKGHVRCNHYEGVVSKACQKVISAFEAGGARFAMRPGARLASPSASSTASSKTRRVASKRRRSTSSSSSAASASPPASTVSASTHTSGSKRPRRAVMVPPRYADFTRADEGASGDDSDFE